MRIYDCVMDTDAAADILHHDFWDWDRFEFSRTSRQIFAETAAKYFEKKLLPLCSHMVGSLNARESLTDFASKIPFSQGIYIEEILLNASTGIGGFPSGFRFEFSLGSQWSLLAGLPNLKIINVYIRSPMLLGSYGHVVIQGGFEIKYVKTRSNALLV
jgi:hypothetical protein